MAKKKDDSGSVKKITHLRSETKRSIFAILFFALALFFTLSGIEKAGVVGSDVYKIFSNLLGIGYFLVPTTCLILAIAFLRAIREGFVWLKVVGSIIFFLGSLGLIHLISPGKAGLSGSLIAGPLLQLFDLGGSLLILGSLVIISMITVFDVAFALPSFSLDNLKSFFGLKKKDDGEITITGDDLSKDEDTSPEGTEYQAEENNSPGVPALARQNELGKEVSSLGGGSMHWALRDESFTPPPLSLLERDKGKPDVGDVKANANIIKRTLQNFGIIVEMDEITIGPTVTRYALKPAEGVKLSRIVALQNDLALALAAHPIRIEAPIPGKSLVGVEIPNTVKATVGIGNLLASDEFQNSDKPLLVGLGKGISGKSHFANLAKMPHLLIAGATGSGKSVSIHALITSLLYRNPPQNMRFIMIDPKRVELTLYNKIPHLLTPVITEAKKAILSLRWAGKEMERRYDILESESVRDIESYHKNVVAPALEKMKKKGGDEESSLPEAMPYIVIIIDELADIMQTYPRELEGAIVRLAQMSRAVGIHLILSTQRPSVNVITGLIKANVPARVALQVASQIDSRTILDMAGAEKLLGAGDMLYLSGEMSQPQRIQSPYISENEVKKVVKFLVDQAKDSIPDEINLQAMNANGVAISDSNSLDDGEEDDLYEAAREEVLKAGKASTSYLQRRLGVGYARAAKLIDMLEERGVVSAAEGNKPRDVLGREPSGEEVSNE